MSDSREELSKQLDEVEQTLRTWECQTGPWPIVDGQPFPPLPEMMKCPHCLSLILIARIRQVLLGTEVVVDPAKWATSIRADLQPK
jgi:hypothetical protein